ncbi:hypothetical protein OIU78_017271 [Salix suchowensis]|nr:hypothetical protein OIU78_017271 [Salix suchowensis]
MAPAPMPVNVPDPDFQILTTVRHEIIRTLKFLSRRVTWTRGLPGTRQAAIRLELLRVIAEAREARMVENLRNSTEFSTNEIRAMVDDPATKASKAQMEERKAKEEMTQNSSQIQLKKIDDSTNLPKKGKFAVHNLPKTAKNEWVICRVLQKSSAGKKTYISGLVRPGSFGSEFSPSGLPPLTDSSPYNGNVKSVADSAYVPCFSNLVQRNQQDTIDSFSNHLLAVSSNPSEVSPRIPLLNSFYSPQAVPASGNFDYPGSVSIQDHSVLKSLIENQGSNMKHQISKPERDMASASQDSATDMNTEISSVISNLEVGNRSFDEQEVPPSTLVQSMDLYCFWNY